MKKQQQFYVGVAGAGVCSPEIYALARQVGYRLALENLIIISGGRGGTMEAVARGAKEGGGKTIGILPNQDYAELNSYIDYPIATGLGQGRNLIIVLNSRVLVAIGGESGTLSEIALALKHGIPVVALRSWDLLKIDSGLELFHPVENVDECISQVLELIKKE